jgi:protein-L-isoaspartate(D-aspartate) O-methyltransferase
MSSTRRTPRHVSFLQRIESFGWLLGILCLHATACGQEERKPSQSKTREGNVAETHDTKAAADTVTDKPRSDEYSDDRKAMVAGQIAARGVRDDKVLAAMRAVPRHWFVPKRLEPVAYADRPLPIGEGQTISQPYIVAFMTEALKLDATSRVLEIGTGSGYQAAVLSEITPHVYTIEIVEPLGRRAIETFRRHGYDTIEAKIGDGYGGWPEHAPFDAVIVTCAPDHIPPKLIEQLKPGGRMCIPVGDELRVQHLVRVTKDENGQFDKERLMPVRFVPMTGEAQSSKPD